MFKKPFWHKLFGTKPNEGMQPKECMAYSITGFGQNLICTMISSYLTVFMTDALGFNINMKICGTSGVFAVAYLMLFTRIFDALNDPIMGSIVDRTRTKWGKCRPYLKWMPLPIGLITIACFLPFYKANGTGFAIISTVYVIWSIVYTIADVPYWGLSTAMTNDTEQRGKLLTVARLFCVVGAGVVQLLVPIIAGAIGEPFKDDLGNYGTGYDEAMKKTYFIITIVVVILAIPMFYYGFKNTRERYTAKGKPPTLGHNFKLLFKNKPLMLLVLSGVLGSARMVYLGTGGLYFCKYAYGEEGLYSLVTLLVVPGGLLASVMVPYFTKKYGKKNTYIWSHIIGAIFMAIMTAVGYRSTGAKVFAIIALIVLGIPQGFANIMTYAMIGDTVDYLEWKTGERGEGICFAMQTFINKIGLAMSAFIGVIAYGMAGITPEFAGEIKPHDLDKLWYIMMITGSASMFLCVVPLFFYNLTEKKQQQITQELEARKAEQA